MKVTEHIQKAKSTLFSIELLPPLKGQRIDSIYACMDELIEFEPAFVDVTYHREEYYYRDAGNGLLERRTTRKRPGTVGICTSIMHKYNIDTIPHIICGGFTKEETENALIDLHFVGIENVLLLRGDAIKSEGRFKPEENGHRYASDLLSQVAQLNKGQYLDEELTNSESTDFCMGIAGYPEKHFEAPNAESDLRYLKMKVDMGAEYIVTQMFFDNQQYFDFVSKCRKEGILVPIIPGLKPITAVNQLNMIPQTFHVDFPDPLVKELQRAKSKQAVKQIGIDWCIEQSKELKATGAPCIHYYTMGKAHAIRTIAEQVF